MAIPQIIQPPIGLAAGVNLAINDMTGPASYVTGGVTISASVFGLQSLKFVDGMTSTDGLNFVRFWFLNPTMGSPTVKVQWFVQSTGAEVGNGVNLSTKKVRCLAIGI